MPEPMPHNATATPPTSPNDPDAPAFPAPPDSPAELDACPLVFDFDQELCDLVADTAPAVFAVCEEEGRDDDMPNGWVVAWGLTWEDGTTYAVSADTAPGRARSMTLTSPERALWWFGAWRGADVRLVWLRPAPGATYDAEGARSASGAA